ncbi:tyrosine-type recombinase/integrase [Moraxella canis]|uniref:Tyrosine-type recombinase/integrase n=1 Tax=Moraxella canis TaxID=90239 RepID=A0ABZ0WYC1_9GAMM|nr:tyrosine-type recombinase/integrase [Moraxella canis]WQE04040.1 tyrosine-type recombinase/integrase [Moraxella canis]
MFIIQKIEVLNKRMFVLIDCETTLPLLYPMLYCANKLVDRAPATQQNILLHIRRFYEYWHNKTGYTFCYSVSKSGKNFSFLPYELEIFHMYLVDKYIDNTPLSKTSAASLAQQVLDVCCFFEFIVNLLNSNKSSFHELSRLQELKRYFGAMVKKRPRNFMFGSLDNFAEAIVRQIIRPSTVKNPNALNPFKTQALQVRNYLIIDLMFKYGLRIGELLSLELGSIEKTATSSLLKINCGRAHDPRRQRPSVKNVHSIRVLNLADEDYKNLQLYILKFRDKSSGSNFLFLSDAKKHDTPLTYRAVYGIFSQIDQVIKNQIKLDPVLYDGLSSMPKFTPHTTRHTWAYRTLKNFYLETERQNLKKAQINGVGFSIQGIMDDAKGKLRSLGGWSQKSTMPDLYAKRFIFENANDANLKRLKYEKQDFTLSLEDFE